MTLDNNLSSKYHQLDLTLCFSLKTNAFNNYINECHIEIFIEKSA